MQESHLQSTTFKHHHPLPLSPGSPSAPFADIPELSSELDEVLDPSLLIACLLPALVVREFDLLLRAHLLQLRQAAPTAQSVSTRAHTSHSPRCCKQRASQGIEEAQAVAMLRHVLQRPHQPLRQVLLRRIPSTQLETSHGIRQSHGHVEDRALLLARNRFRNVREHLAMGEKPELTFILRGTHTFCSELKCLRVEAVCERTIPTETGCQERREREMEKRWRVGCTLVNRGKEKKSGAYKVMVVRSSTRRSLSQSV
eukprot:1107927-Rhodomonas_salina.2